MGYYTDFELTIGDGVARTEVRGVDADGNPVSVFIETSITVDDVVNIIGEDPFDERCKWYDWKEDMIRVSKEYRDILFTIDANGEESGDIWRAYFKNGKSQICQAKITFDECTL